MPNKITTRAMPVNLTGGTPATFDFDTRKVEAIMATQQPVLVFDWDLGAVEEVLLMDGATYPSKVPLLDSHDRSSVETVLGSVENIRTEGENMLGTVTFSKVREADNAMVKLDEGHLTDFSVGYRVKESIYIPAGKSEKIGNRNFNGPLKVCTKWELMELSITPIGADDQAKARSLQQENTTMPEQNHTPDKDQARKAIEAERTRSDEILGLGSEFDMMEQARAAIKGGIEVDEFRKQVLKAMAEQRAETPAPGFRVEAGQTDGEKFRAAAEDSLLLRGGLIQESKTGTDLAALSLRELARECLTRSGQRALGGNAMQIIGRALTSSDFPKILANSANKSLMSGYESAGETWNQWCGIGQASDFKTHTLVRPSEMSDLDEVGEMEEFTHGSRTEAQEQYSVTTYGKLFAISRQAIINDDLSALTTVPSGHGEAAARKVGDIAYAALTANSNMGDGTALFHADHGNLGTAAFAVDAVGAGVAAMKIQKDLAGLRTLNIRPRYFLAPINLEFSAEQVFANTVVGTQAEPNVKNPYAGSYFERVYEPRLDDDNASAWYLAGPKGKTIVVFFLNGVQKPYLESRDGFSIDGVEYKVRIDAGAKAVDWRAIYKSTGAE